MVFIKVTVVYTATKDTTVTKDVTVTMDIKVTTVTKDNSLVGITLNHIMGHTMEANITNLVEAITSLMDMVAHLHMVVLPLMVAHLLMVARRHVNRVSSSLVTTLVEFRCQACTLRSRISQIANLTVKTHRIVAKNS